MPRCDTKTVDPARLRAALLTLLRTKGVECSEDSVKVSHLARETAPAAYFVTASASCAPILAAELTRITGRPMLSPQPAWVFFQNEAQSIVAGLGPPD
jgi:hypothetical protein